ncbi:MAG: hypothetical protein JWN45_3440 [Acidobacteriaceae bacterium]|jgi:hypothetical protein|nr:hypothetical protein [Acidobacteriaceae bacterium]
MKNAKLVVNTIVVLAFSTILMAAQMQMPNSASTVEKSTTPKTLTGIVSDSMCGAHHMEKDKSPAECTRMCVKQGMKYALVVGSKVYTLEGHEAELDKVAGTKSTLKGKISGETVAVESVESATKVK